MTNLPDGYYKVMLPDSQAVLGEVKGGVFDSHVWRGSVEDMLYIGYVFTRLVEEGTR